MIKKVHLIGCGNVGSKIAIKLVKYQFVEEIHLYDPGSIVKSFNYPFNLTNVPITKVDFLTYYLGSDHFDKNIIIVPHYGYVTDNVELDCNLETDIVIDVRDYKTNYQIKSDLNASIDGHLLLIGKEYSPTCSFGEYIKGADELYSDMAANIILKYMFNLKFLKSGLYELNLEEFLFEKNNGEY